MCVCVCVFTSIFLKEGNRSGVYDTKLVLLDRNEIFSSDVFYLDIYLSSKLKKFLITYNVRSARWWGTHDQKQSKISFPQEGHPGGETTT